MACTGISRRVQVVVELSDEVGEGETFAALHLVDSSDGSGGVEVEESIADGEDVFAIRMSNAGVDGSLVHSSEGHAGGLKDVENAPHVALSEVDQSLPPRPWPARRPPRRRRFAAVEAFGWY